MVTRKKSYFLCVVNNEKGARYMKNTTESDNLPLFLGVEVIQKDMSVSRSKAYEIIKKLNTDMKREYPEALVVNGRVNRFWYQKACLMDRKEGT